jgi:hypothetical protein
MLLPYLIDRHCDMKYGSTVAVCATVSLPALCVEPGHLIICGSLCQEHNSLDIIKNRFASTIIAHNDEISGSRRRKCAVFNTNLFKQSMVSHNRIKSLYNL